MIDIFLHSDVRNLMRKKSIVFLGDSNIRALYKDFLCLLTKSKLISDDILRKKMENSVFGDKLRFHGERTNGRDYREERGGTVNNTHVSFYFLTRVYDKYVNEVLSRITSNRKPDVLVINCCLWDVTRWGATGVEDYKINLQTLLKRLKHLLPDCLVIWMTAPPISVELRGGFLVKELEFLKYSLRFHVMEANHFARKVVVENGFDLLDSHYHLKMQIHRRSRDGIHWLPAAVRYVTNLLLTHISLAWNVPLPHRSESSLMEKNLSLLEDEVSTVVPVKEEKEPVQKEDSIAVTKPVDKENCDTPQPATKRQKRRRTPLKKTNKSNSHHQYLKKVQQQKRLTRVRQWRNSPSHTEFSPGPSAASSRYNSPIRHSPQQDSGYFPSPIEASLSNESYHFNRRNITFGSPARVQSHGYTNACNFEPFSNRRMSGISAYQPYNVQDIPLPSETYQSYPVQDVPLPYEPYQFPPRGHMQNYARLPQEPYSFPHVAQGQILRPKIDFTSDDFLAY